MKTQTIENLEKFLKEYDFYATKWTDGNGTTWLVMRNSDERVLVRGRKTKGVAIEDASKLLNNEL